MDVSHKPFRLPIRNTCVSLYHGEIIYLDTDHSQQPMAEALENSIQNGAYCDKRIFYQVSEWPDSRGSTQTRGEVEIIRRLAPQIAADLKDWHEPLLVEYGPGDGLKTEILLDAIESRCIKCTYVGVDINQRCLDRCLAAWKEKYTFIKCTGICGSFEDATSLVEKWPGNKFVFSLASTPNSKPVEYILFLQRLAKLARKIIISQQRPDGQQGLHNSYHTEDFEKFVWRGLQHGNRLLKRPEFNEQDWEIKCDHSKTNIYWCHEFKITPLRSTDQKSSFQAFASIKYTDAGFVMIAKNAGLEVTRTDKNDDTGMGKQLEQSALATLLKLSQQYINW
ncbi:hypothetical protein FPOAC1_007259 [Fusarium poae]|uniref:hypothetical protein n=1 Tax=Fusarium poae TaxID=36050 RepID=UPI001CE7C4B7|nr:hypothetical protein FPOAC1_007259 [Fusarium poae]KAG8673940.1 hypothetical protein FPOAC1_007259 [Fusarium poae]